ncbi:MAG: SDR family NAD(P)-dependent oxidoreductase [Hyphomicrobiaceae bacterium]
MRLAGKVALISGGGKGIGAATSRRFAEEGAHVGIGDVDRGAGAAQAQQLSDAGLSATFVALDVTQAASWQSALQTLTEQHGGVDILVNNAGIYYRHGLESVDETEWDSVLAVNAKGPFLGAKAAIPSMKQRGGGSIINISSTAGIRGSIAPHYGASKGAVRLLTKSIAVNFARDGIRCNSVHPGPIDTEMGHAAVPQDHRDQRLARVPLGRFGRPDEIANAILFLASDESSFMTGSELVVDGGSTAG